MKRNIYLETVSLDEAVSRLKVALDRETLLGTETIAVENAAGRITAAPIFAGHSSPIVHGAAMDGIAVRARDTFAAREGRPLRLPAGTGFAPVNTGNPLPRDFDAVIMIENVVMDGPDALIEAPAAPFAHVRRIGEDIVATELILPRHRRVTPYDIGALLSCGVFDISVFESPRLTIIPTGDEVLDYTLRPTPEAGQVVESNSMMLSALAASWGLTPRRVPPVPDDFEALCAAFEAALDSEAHAVVLVAGSSAGSKDFSRAVIEKFGRVLVHGVAAMPGKPSILGVCRGKLAVGAPGYPVSSVVCFEEILRPLAAWLTRTTPPARPEITVGLARATPSRPGMEEFIRLAVGRVGDNYVGLPLSRGAGMISTLTKAQAVARIPAGTEGLEAGARVQARLVVDEADLVNTLVVVGSHDNSLDLLADALMRFDPAIRLASSHVGSMGGISALKGGAALMAGAHLFDPESGDFNFPSLARFAPELDLAVINLAIRHQGLIVAPGNPKGIVGAADLARPGVTFVNRQRGAGTRILLDHHLNKAGLDPGQVAGYSHEEHTHMAVAVNVATGAADCGLGVHAAARALGLSFAPLARERYDLLIPRAFLSDPRIEAVLQVIASTDFRRRLEALGGYETTLTGRKMRPGQGLGE